jgi:hypothetical protein
VSTINKNVLNYLSTDGLKIVFTSEVILSTNTCYMHHKVVSLAVPSVFKTTNSLQVFAIKVTVGHICYVAKLTKFKKLPYSQLYNFSQ